MDVVADLGWRGMLYQSTHDDLGERMAANRPVVAYHGIDATASSLHVGNLLGVLALQRLQQAGHRPVALLGGATTLIGDPSGKATERPLRAAEEVEANVAGIRHQLERFLDFSAGGAVLVDNSEWFTSMPVTAFLRDIGRHFGVNTMLDKESVRSRLAAGISFTEFSYMLLQAYDFVHLHDRLGCRLQVGGSDQWGNITAGVDLVRRMRGAEVWGLTWPLLTRSDGSKFGKSESGNVWLDPDLTSPYEFFQFWMRTDDADVEAMLGRFTSRTRDEIHELVADHARRPQARQAQLALALDVTATVHGGEEAAAARRTARSLFEGDLRDLTEAGLLQAFSEAPSSDLPRSALSGEGVAVVDLLARTGLVSSSSEARRVVSQGGAYLNNARVLDVDARATTDDLLHGRYAVLRRGKRHHHLVRFAG